MEPLFWEGSKGGFGASSGCLLYRGDRFVERESPNRALSDSMNFSERDEINGVLLVTLGLSIFIFLYYVVTT